VFLGLGKSGLMWGGAEHAVLVLGPPRSGKTSSVVIPSVASAPGAVVSTSTKPDVLAVTAPLRAEHGPCLLYDPSGTVDRPAGVEPVRWSPVTGCGRWDDALVVAHGLVHSARPSSTARGGVAHDDHWTERAHALLASALHAAALDGADMSAVLRWVDRHDAASPLGVLDREGADRAGDLLAGIAATDAREQSGIWSTASGALSAYRSEAALATTRHPNFDADAFCAQNATLYVCATGRRQATLAPLVVGLLGDVRAAAYARAAEEIRRGGPRSAPVLAALDEVANIAPIPDLPAMVSEGGGQGVITLACLQDLSQARSRWGAAADGFLSLFGTTVVLPGIGDVATLQALSALAGEHEVVRRSVSTAASGSGIGFGDVVGRVVLGRPLPPRDSGPRVSTSTTRERRLPVDVISRGRLGAALVVGTRNQMGWVHLTPWFGEPWRSLLIRERATPVRDGPVRDGPVRDGPDRDGPDRDGPDRDQPAPDTPGPAGARNGPAASLGR
jgi:type IV secretion system protein VirD4